MGFFLHDASYQHTLTINFWNWRTIVELLRGLDVLDASVVDGLHEQFVGTGLSRDQARTAAAALREQILPGLSDDVRIKLDGSRTSQPDTGVFHRPSSGQFAENYSTSRRVLLEVIDYFDATDGFTLS